MEQMTQTQLIHAHEILYMILEAPTAPSPDDLRRQVEDRFGAEALFTNCTGQAYDFHQMITVLASRGKIMVTPEGITVRREEICDHD